MVRSNEALRRFGINDGPRNMDGLRFSDITESGEALDLGGLVRLPLASGIYQAGLSRIGRAEGSARAPSMAPSRPEARGR